MNPESVQKRRGSATGAVIAIVVGLAAIVFAGVWVRQDRNRFQGQIETLRADLATAHARNAELQKQLAVASEARDQAEKEARETETAAAATRNELQQQEQELTGRIQQLESVLQDFQKRLATTEEEAEKVAAELSRERERREAAEQEVADANDQLQEQVALVSRLQGSAQETGSGAGATAPAEGVSGSASSQAAPAAKQSFADANPSGPKTAFDTAPEPLDLAAPEYPRGLKREGAEGHVVVAFTVNTHGRVGAVEVRESSHEAFADAAEAAVRQWRFKPARRDGEPVEVRMSQRLEFKSN